MTPLLLFQYMAAFGAGLGAIILVVAGAYYISES